MPVIEVVGQGLVEFPDTMSDDEILAVLRRTAPGPQQGPPGQQGKYGGVPGSQFDLTETTGEKVQSAIGDVTSRLGGWGAGLLGRGTELAANAAENVGQAEKWVASKLPKTDIIGPAITGLSIAYGWPTDNVIDPVAGALGRASDAVPAVQQKIGNMVADREAFEDALPAGSLTADVAKYVVGPQKLGLVKSAKGAFGRASVKVLDRVDRLLTAGLTDGAITVGTADEISDVTRQFLTSAGIGMAGVGLAEAGALMATKLPKSLINKLLHVGKTDGNVKRALSGRSPADILAKEKVSGVTLDGVLTNLSKKTDEVNAAYEAASKASTQPINIRPFVSVKLQQLRRQYATHPEILSAIDRQLQTFDDLFAQGAKVTGVRLPPEKALELKRWYGNQIGVFERGKLAEDTATMAADDLARKTIFDAINKAIWTKVPEAEKYGQRLLDLIETQRVFQKTWR